MYKAIVQIGGYQIRVRTSGPASGPRAIVLPGMGATAFAVAPQIRALRSLGYTVHIVELPGFGVGPALRKEDARFDQLADLVLAVADKLGIGRAVFLGHSLGGGIALHIALKRPAMVAGLVLLAPAALGRSLVWTYKLFCLPLVGRALLRPYRHGSRDFLRHFLIGSGRRNDTHFIERLLREDTQSPAKTRSMRAIVWANQPARWRRIALFFMPGGEQSAYALGGRLDALRDTPTLVLWGNEDAVISVRDADLLRKANPNAEVHIARGVGHMLPLEASTWTNEHIAWFDSLHLRRNRQAVA